MKKLFDLRNIILFVPLLSLQTPQAIAQAQQAKAPPDELFRTIASLDAALFDAYNRCDVEKFASLIADDLEFYHDQTGLSRGKQSTIDALKNNVCGKVHRDLVSGTLEVYPLNKFGAVEIGIHRFCDPKMGKCGEGSGEAKFIHLWENKNGTWQLTRVISYDHCSNCVKTAKPE